LDIWRLGQVAGWGSVEKLDTGKDSLNEKIEFHTRSLKSYKSSSLMKKQLSSGLYLLDFIPLRQNKDTGETVSLLIVAVCRNILDKKDAIYCLKVRSKAGSEDIKHIVLPGQTIPKKRRSQYSYRKKPSRATFENIPVNAQPRKH
jgi:hypothetical protein